MSDALPPPDLYPEYHGLSQAQAELYCSGSEAQRVRVEIARKVGDRTVLDVGCGNGIDADFYATSRYVGLDLSQALVTAARKKHPRHIFVQADLAKLRRKSVQTHFQVCYTKSVLEHTARVEDAVAILSSMLQIASEAVYVAWHTPPRAAEAAELHRVRGHYGYVVNQNVYRLADFVEVIGDRRWTTTQIDNFTLWEIVP